jgi:hypothetical protein
MLRSVFLLSILFIFCPIFATAQTDIALLRELAEENKKSVDALVLYPTETRLAILEATTHPEVLVKMQSMRAKTSAAFRTLVEDFPRTTQSVFYDLNRYNGLVAALIYEQSEHAALRRSLVVLPEEKRNEAFDVVESQMPTLLKINDLNTTTSCAFELLIEGYPGVAQSAFEHLLGLPEVIDLLNEDLRFTILVGETYRDTPAWTIRKMDSLNLAVEQVQAEELKSWKNDIENDPAALDELQSAARDYAYENASDTEYYSGEELFHYQNETYFQDYYQPYSYWYGYPYWSPNPRWHPYPWWWDWGGQFHPQGLVIVYLPSYYFMQWYFNEPLHHRDYNHLSTHFVNHYNGHRRSGTTISSSVREWREQNRVVISEDFLMDKKRLPERLDEFGKFEQGRVEFNAKNPKKPVSQEQFLEKNSRKFPEIQRSRREAKPEMQSDADQKRDKMKEWAPAYPDPIPDTGSKPSRVPIPTQPTQINPKPISEPEPVTRPQVQPNRAKDYQRQKMQELKPKQQPQRINPIQAPSPGRVPTKSSLKSRKIIDK